MKKYAPPVSYIDDIIKYNELTGELTWKVSRGSVRAGRRAGSPSHSRGKTYIHVRIDKVFYNAHHIAWALYYGEWPKMHIDHIDGDGENNAIANLRLCSIAENKWNSKKYRTNTSGFKNVVKHSSGKWYFTIQKNGVREISEKFDTPSAAHAAYVEKARELFGVFSRAA